MYRSSGEMAETRKLKSLMTKTWFKSKRGGQNQTVKKDIPHYLKDQEIRTRKREGNTKKADLPPQEIEETEYSIEGGGVQETSREVKEVETIIFIPSTPDSILKTSLQNQDNQIAQATNTPQVRFVERAGTTIMEELGRTNLWPPNGSAQGKTAFRARAGLSWPRKKRKKH